MSNSIPVFNSSRAFASSEQNGPEVQLDQEAESNSMLSARQTSASTASIKYEPLVIGIKRNLVRYTQQVIDGAQAAYRAMRASRLAASGYKCHYCGIRSKRNGLDHLDGNHHNSVDENTVCACPLCHAYHHVGQESLDAAKPGLNEALLGGNKQMILIRAPVNPNLSAQEFNHLLRAIAMALTDENEAPQALKVLTALVSPEIRRDMQESFVSAWPSDVGLALSKLTEDEYKKSRYIMRDVRAIFSPDVLRPLGRLWSEEQPAFADPAQWPQLMSKTMDLLEDQEQGVGVESLLDSDASAASKSSESQMIYHEHEDDDHDDD